jgi:hypothetical protein
LSFSKIGQGFVVSLLEVRPRTGGGSGRPGGCIVGVASIVEVIGITIAGCEIAGDVVGYVHRVRKDAVTAVVADAVTINAILSATDNDAVPVVAVCGAIFDSAVFPADINAILAVAAGGGTDDGAVVPDRDANSADELAAVAVCGAIFDGGVISDINAIIDIDAGGGNWSRTGEHCMWRRDLEAQQIRSGKKGGSAERWIHRVVNRLCLGLLFYPLMAELLKS